MFAKISGTGSYLPKQLISNNELCKIVDTSDEWIKQRVGIENRHCANKDETTTFMAVESAKQAIKLSNINIEDIDAIIVATSTADFIMPSTASEVQRELGIKKHSVRCFDINAACSVLFMLLILLNNILNLKYARMY